MWILYSGDHFVLAPRNAHMVGVGGNSTLHPKRRRRKNTHRRTQCARFFRRKYINEIVLIRRVVRGASALPFTPPAAQRQDRRRRLAAHFILRRTHAFNHDQRTVKHANRDDDDDDATHRRTLLCRHDDTPTSKHSQRLGVTIYSPTYTQPHAAQRRQSPTHNITDKAKLRATACDEAKTQTRNKAQQRRSTTTEVPAVDRRMRRIRWGCRHVRVCLWCVITSACAALTSALHRRTH